MALAPLIHDSLGNPSTVSVTAFDGTSAGPPDPRLRIDVKNRNAILRLLQRPGELGLVRAYVSGDLDGDGDMYTLIELAPDGPRAQPAVQAERRTGQGDARRGRDRCPQAGSPTARRGTPYAAGCTRSRPRLRSGFVPLRRVERVLRARAGPGHDLLVCRVRPPGPGAGRRSGQQARADLPEVAGHGGDPAARRRMRVGLDAAPRRPAPWGPPAWGSPSRASSTSSQPSGSLTPGSRPDRDPAPGLPGHRRRTVRTRSRRSACSNTSAERRCRSTTARCSTCCDPAAAS